MLNDKELNGKYPHLAAAADVAKNGKFFPAMPYFSPVADIVTRRVLQVMTNELQAKEAMDLAAAEGNKYLADNGWFKS
jgi:maltose-binding protein MalE